MNKFQRNFKLEVEGKDGNIYSFNYPMTLEFNVTRAALASTNTANLRVYNLNPDTRKILYKDIYDNVTGSFRSVKLYAGYGDSLPLILSGHIKESKSYRESGSTNFITEIDCYDWSFAMINAESGWVLGPPDYSLPLKRSVVIERLVSDLLKSSPANASLSRGYISDFDTIGAAPYSRPFRASGNTWEYLRTETNDHCYIDNGVLHCLLDDDCFEGDIRILDSSTGLLSTPKKSQYMLKIDILFEPSIKIGQQVQLISASETLFNGVYKVIGIQHSGTISGAVSGKCRTSLTLNAGEFSLNVITGRVTSTPVPLGTT